MYNTTTKTLLALVMADALALTYKNKDTDSKVNPGNWSEVGSLNLVMADALAVKGYNLTFMASYLCQWKFNAIWTPNGEKNIEDSITSNSIDQLRLFIIEDKEDDLVLLKTKEIDSENSNGSLKRMLPLLFYIKDMPIHQQYISVREVSALTHKHSRAAMAALIYLKLAEYLLAGQKPKEAYTSMQKEIIELWTVIGYKEAHLFENIIASPIFELNKENLIFSENVINTLEASLWAFYNNDSYLKVVFDTLQFPRISSAVATLAAGLASLSYDINDIPKEWLEKLARIKDIENLGNRLSSRF